MRPLRHLLAGLAVVVATATPAAAAGWTDLPAPADPLSQMGTPGLAASADGRLTAAWSGYTGSAFPVVAAVREPGTGWGEPQELISAPSMVNPPAVAVDPSGRAIVAWTRCASSLWRVEVAERPPDGPWGSPVTLASGPCLRTDTRAFATVDAAGRVVLAWTSSDPFHLWTAASPPEGGWTTPERLGAGAVDPSVGLAATDDGGVLAAWNLESGTGAVQVAARDAQGTWGAPATLTSTTASRSEAALALAGGDRAIVAWREGGWSDARAWAVARDEDGTWGTPAAVSGAATGVYGVSAAADAEGRATVAWVSGAGPGAATGTTQALGPAGAPGTDGRTVWSLAPAFAPGGAPLLAWSDGVRAGVTAHDGTWGPGATLGPAQAGAGTPVVRDVPGATLVARAQGGGTSFGHVTQAVLRVSVLDARAPRLSLAPPARAVAGEPVTLAAEAADDWSAVGEVTWTLGDGATAAGTSVDHLYASPGTYPVTARVEDAVGNASTTGFDLVVVAPPRQPAVPGAPAAPEAPPAGPSPRSRPPAASVRLPGPATLRAAAGAVTVPVACAGARCTGRVELLSGARSLGAGALDAAAGRRTAVALRLRPAALRRLAGAARVRAVVVVRLRDGAAWRVAARRPVVLLPPR